MSWLWWIDLQRGTRLIQCDGFLHSSVFIVLVQAISTDQHKQNTMGNIYVVLK